MRKTDLRPTLRALFKQERGNFAMITAVALPVMLIAGSLALDTANMTSLRVRLQNAADSAALATSAQLAKGDLIQTNAVAFAEQFLSGQLTEDNSAFTDLTVTPAVVVTPVTDADGNIVWRVAITMQGQMASTKLARIMGRDTLDVSVLGKSESQAATKSALSMVLVLDKSGSMGEYSGGVEKIEALKTAVGSLLDQLDEADPKQKYVRTGAVSYDDQLDKKSNIKWGTSKVRSFVGKLEADGRTDSTDAFSWGYDQVSAKKELTEHEASTGLVPTEIMVFMTDGDNNYDSADISTKKLCDEARADKVEVYTVAFAAPSGGKALLSYCATSTQHYFDAKNSAELIAAFKNIGMRASNMVTRLTQ
ncbi:Flp pilus assembly protein TadG [Hoeflea marina]|uniref:Flp pilus assembly protein TadG n=1 Tax=Hoeflea marina TaxID=274592 RepID=A0A317PTM3_9HYPH|nr:TadE/TadG family type IV pilus assembly protein [Hoeflea marina]PWW02174.1 Flp pilus assembly protein TadG [Hoeflea marina]